MSKEIVMYNAYFGDCFMLNNGNSHLLVDFGVHKLSKIDTSKYGSRIDLIESIANDIKNNYATPSVLITHFHDDHICGLIHMYKQKQFNHFFNKIYIPNVWENPFAVVSNILEEMILKAQLENSQLPNSNASLFDLVEFLCCDLKKVVLLNRGMSFEDNRYMTLWPPKYKKEDETEYQTVLNELGIREELINDLYTLSKKVCVFMQNALEEREIEGIDIIEEFRVEYMTIEEKYESDLKELIVSEKLNKLNHKINIVFHDKDSNEENVLFTGDVELPDMCKIASKAASPSMHSKYVFIKIPHHGTRKHYFDFSPYEPNYISITNGEISLSSKKTAYMIDCQYGYLDANRVCSNANNCLNYRKTCAIKHTCAGKSKNIIFPKLSKKIIISLGCIMVIK